MKKLIAVIFTVTVYCPVFAAGGGTDIFDLLPRIVNFAVLFGVIFYFGRGPITRMLKENAEKRVNLYAVAKEEESEAQKKMAAYEVNLQAMQSEIQALKQSYEKEIEMERNKILEESETISENMKKNAELLIESKLSAAKSELVSYIVESAVDELKKELAERPEKLAAADLNETFINRLKGKVQ